MTITEQQEKFIWLAHAECKSFSEIEKLLNLPRATISEWEKELRPIWQDLAAIRKIYAVKKFTIDFKKFHEWYLLVEKDKSCCYCGISETELKELIDNKKIETKRSRGRKLELDRKEPNSSYEELDNIVYACYWCNNAKTDTFSHKEFLEIGKVISKIWKQRMLK